MSDVSDYLCEKHSRLTQESLRYPGGWFYLNIFMKVDKRMNSRFSCHGNGRWARQPQSPAFCVRRRGKGRSNFPAQPNMPDGDYAMLVGTLKPAPDRSVENRDFF